MYKNKRFIDLHFGLIKCGLAAGGSMLRHLEFACTASYTFNSLPL